MRCNYSSTGTTLSLHVSSQGLWIILLLLFNGWITTERASVVVFFDFRHFWVYKKYEKKKRDCESGRASNHNHNWTPVQSQIQAAKAGRQAGQPENSARALTEWVHHHVVVVCASRNHQRRSRRRQCWSGALKRKIQPSLRYDYIGDGITRSLDYGRGKWSKSKLVLFLYYFI